MSDALPIEDSVRFEQSDSAQDATEQLMASGIQSEAWSGWDLYRILSPRHNLQLRRPGKE